MKHPWKHPYVYLKKQFEHPERYLRKIEAVTRRGDFTLGREVAVFEAQAALMLGVNHVIGVGNGTDALYLIFKALGIGAGDEVITAPNSFVATAAAIALTGARPVFADVRDDYTIDPKLIEKVITKKTKAIIPVHLTGQPADMKPIMSIAKRHHLAVVEDVAQAFLARYDSKYLGTIGIAGAFSFHPLKILHVWGDGGMITTNDATLAGKLMLWRNHGLKTRNGVEFFAHNSRLDTIHAAIASVLLPQMPGVVKKRQAVARLYDQLLNPLAHSIHIPDRHLCTAPQSHTYTNYVVMAKRRDALIAYLAKQGIEAVIQYPIPIHLQKAARYLGYKKGDFPVCERQANEIVTLPCHQYMTARDAREIVSAIAGFYSK
ncbi:DegT/DnrJ/EryC1/StrS family aminotransferase [Candidatus Gottesmanbacteria bacterium]|nr:DegT/DnrJ/EryC1/StrS family aminotransferase [Candidatus Gottesmanbacteria bacterium]